MFWLFRSCTYVYTRIIMQKTAMICDFHMSHGGSWSYMSFTLLRTNNKPLIVEPTGFYGPLLCLFWEVYNGGSTFQGRIDVSKFHCCYMLQSYSMLSFSMWRTCKDMLIFFLRINDQTFVQNVCWHLSQTKGGTKKNRRFKDVETTPWYFWHCGFVLMHHR